MFFKTLHGLNWFEKLILLIQANKIPDGSNFIVTQISDRLTKRNFNATMPQA